ncbi:MAG: hypothetical protein BWY37_02241 [Firmicutes bacterium ADurb.Bin262]|nr:MAG: hypothetical protein BWY37_02241 [Firmicutes bacterium ADurb.Bin262]
MKKNIITMVVMLMASVAMADLMSVTAANTDRQGLVYATSNVLAYVAQTTARVGDDSAGNAFVYIIPFQLPALTGGTTISISAVSCTSTTTGAGATTSATGRTTASTMTGAGSAATICATGATGSGAGISTSTGASTTGAGAARASATAGKASTTAASTGPAATFSPSLRRSPRPRPPRRPRRRLP